MTSTTFDMQVKTYIAAVAARLDDLPQPERDDLMADLEQHLHEVAAEGEGTLAERVGSPESYAAELRATAGLGPGRAPMKNLTVRGLASSIRRDATEFPLLKPVLTFLPELSPGWWVIRAGVVAFGIHALLSGDASRETRVVFALITAALLAIPSVALGRAAQHNRTARWMSIAGNIPTVIVAFVLLAHMPSDYQQERFEAFLEPMQYSDVYLQHEDGTSISNICAYDSKLQPLGDVLLFDQRGRPIANVADPSGGTAMTEVEDGFANAYPRRQQVDPDTGELLGQPFECPTLGKAEKPKKQ